MESEQLLNIAGALYFLFSIYRTPHPPTVYRKVGTGVSGVPSKYRGFGVYTMNETGGWRKMFIARASVASRVS
jgi:hypothetical protein